MSLYPDSKRTTTAKRRAVQLRTIRRLKTDARTLDSRAMLARTRSR